MATRHLEIDVDGLNKVEAAVALMPQKNRLILRQVLNKLGDFALHYAQLFAPIQIGPGGGELLRRLQKSPIRFKPGGAGGGGWYELLVGIIRGDRYPLYVHGGTGLYRQTGAGRLITPRRPGGWLTFQKHGEPRRFVRYVRGQRPQPFIERAYERTKTYAQAQSIDLGSRFR